MKKQMIKQGVLALMLILAFLFPLRSEAAGPFYVRSVTQYGGSAAVDVRLSNPESGVIVLCVYDRASHRMTDMKTWPDAVAVEHMVTVTLDRVPPSTEYVQAFLMDSDTLRPLCVPVLANYVMSGPDDGEEDPPDGEEEPPDGEEDPEENEDPEQDTEQDTVSRTIFGTDTGTKYHYSQNGGTYYPITWDDVQRRGLTPCSRCVK